MSWGCKTSSRSGSVRAFQIRIRFCPPTTWPITTGIARIDRWAWSRRTVRARSPPSGDASSAALSSAGSTTYINGRRDRHDGVLGPYSRPSLPEGHRIRPARKSPCTGPKAPCGAGYQIGGTHDLILVPHTHNFALRDGGGTWNGDALTLMKSEVDTRTGLRETPSAAPSILPARNQPDRAREVAVASCHLSIRPEMLEQEKKLEWTISHLLKTNTSRGARRHN